MILESFHVTNFRRLRDVHIAVDRDRTIFVGANNSGKTSAAQIFPLFLGDETFSIHDFSGDVWEKFDQASAGTTSWPTITLDLWFEITANDLHRVVDLLPSLNWSAGPVGVRLQYAAKEPLKLFASFQEAQQKAKAPAAGGAGATPGGTYQGWPKSMTDFLTKKLRDEFQIQYFVIDRAHFDADYRPKAEFVPAPLSDESGRGGAAIIQSLVRVDFMKAQRHLSDEAGPGRAEDLSRRLSRFYERNLKQPETDFEAMRALADSETQLNAHLASVFKPTLERLNKLGYPGLANPHLLIKSVLNPESILKGNAHVHYSLRDEKIPGDDFVLPDRYNGLGFKNLIYMVVELLDYHSRWQDQKENQALLHLIIIEEPEAHLHAQLQQVFIREILKIIPDSSPGSPFCSQLIVTTHSPHIIYECGFTPIRYFRRSAVRGRKQGSIVLNLSDFYNRSKTETRDFLQRYLKLTHCDLFFADAAVLVEGNVERLLLPAMIPKSAPELQSCYLSILEVGGAFAHEFKELLEFLGLTALIITDLDSVTPHKPPVPQNAPPSTAPVVEAGTESDDAESVAGRSCLADIPGAVTSNQTLIQWLPKLTTVTDLLAATESAKVQPRGDKSTALIRVAYQSRQPVEWQAKQEHRTGRTLEEAFVLENLAWCQHEDRSRLGLRVRKAEQCSLPDLAEKLSKRIRSQNFDKTEFALGLMTQNSNAWKVPSYIHEGLQWLAAQFPPELSPAPGAPGTPSNPGTS